MLCIIGVSCNAVVKMTATETDKEEERTDFLKVLEPGPASTFTSHACLIRKSNFSDL